MSVDIHFIISLNQFDGDKGALLFPKARHALLCFQLFCYKFHNSQTILFLTNHSSILFKDHFTSYQCYINELYDILDDQTLITFSNNTQLVGSLRACLVIAALLQLVINRSYSCTSESRLKCHPFHNLPIPYTCTLYTIHMYTIYPTHVHYVLLLSMVVPPPWVGYS